MLKLQEKIKVNARNYGIIKTNRFYQSKFNNHYVNIKLIIY